VTCTRWAHWTEVYVPYWRGGGVDRKAVRHREYGVIVKYVTLLVAWRNWATLARG
jgi:hypothetical protein